MLLPRQSAACDDDDVHDDPCVRVFNILLFMI